MRYFYKPSGNHIELVLGTYPTEEWPCMDLSVCRDPSQLTEKYRRINSGITRFGNLVLSLAVANARPTVEPAAVRDGLRGADNFVASAHFFDPDENGRMPNRDALSSLRLGDAAFMGEVVLQDHMLLVRCARQGKFSTSMAYAIGSDGVYRPVHGLRARDLPDGEIALDEVEVVEGFTCEDLPDASMPNTVWPAYDMGLIEEDVAPGLRPVDPDFLAHTALLI